MVLLELLKTRILPPAISTIYVKYYSDVKVQDSFHICSNEHSPVSYAATLKKELQKITENYRNSFFRST